MIEIGTYKVFYQRPDFSDLQGNQLTNEIHAQRYKDRVGEVIAYLKEQSAAYESKNGAGKSCFEVTVEEPLYDIQINGSTGFRAFLDQQAKPDLITSVESQSGAQYVVLAGFVASPFQATVEGYSSRTPLLHMEFSRVCFGVPTGRALTTGEQAARVEMNDLVFEKLRDALTKFKESNPDVIVELEEKRLGSFFLRVTTQENKEHGLQTYALNSYVLGALARDTENVAAILEGPQLYPTDVEQMRRPWTPPSSQPPKRTPKKLDL